MTQKAPSKKATAWIRILLTLLLSAGIGYAIGHWTVPKAPDSSTADPQFSKGLAIALLAGLTLGTFFLSVAWHELGHLLVGLALRFSFLLLTVGPLMVRREGQRLVLRPNRSLNLMGGVTGLAPPREGNLRRQMFCMVAGGPAFSLVASILLLLLVRHTQSLDYLTRTVPPGTFALHLFLLLMAALNTVLVFASLIPTRSGIFYTDGARLLHLLRNNAESRADLQFTATYQQMMAGTRPRDLSLHSLEQLAGYPSLFAPFAKLFLYLHHLDASQLPEATRYAEELLALVPTLPPAQAEGMEAEVGFFYAVFHHDLDKARPLLSEKKLPFTEKHTQHRIAAAAALCQGQKELARTELDRATSLLGTATDRGMAAAEADWIEKMRHDLNS